MEQKGQVWAVRGLGVLYPRRCRIRSPVATIILESGAVFWAGRIAGLFLFSQNQLLAHINRPRVGKLVNLNIE